MRAFAERVDGTEEEVMIEKRLDDCVLILTFPGLILHNGDSLRIESEVPE